MTIKKRTLDGKASYVVFVKVRDKAGKQIARRKTCGTEREAKRIEHEFKMQLESRRTHVTWKSWVGQILEKYRIEYSPSTFHNYKHCLNKWFNPVWSGKYLVEIRPSDVHHAIFENGKGLSSYTQRGLLKIVKRVFNLAIARE